MNSHTIWFTRITTTPIGPLWVASNQVGLVAISLWDDRDRFLSPLNKLADTELVEDPHPLQTVIDQLQQYLAGERQVFDLTIDWSRMSPFQTSVLQAVHQIEYGRYLTYKDVAVKLGKPKAVRAVGRANATNPMPLVIPCHRVLGGDGKLHGFSAPGGLETKAWLLRLEGSWLL